MNTREILEKLQKREEALQKDKEIKVVHIGISDWHEHTASSLMLHEALMARSSNTFKPMAFALAAKTIKVDEDMLARFAPDLHFEITDGYDDETRAKIQASLKEQMDKGTIEFTREQINQAIKDALEE